MSCVGEPANDGVEYWIMDNLTERGLVVMEKLIAKHQWKSNQSYKAGETVRSRSKHWVRKYRMFGIGFGPLVAVEGEEAAYKCVEAG